MAIYKCFIIIIIYYYYYYSYMDIHCIFIAKIISSPHLGVDISSLCCRQTNILNSTEVMSCAI